MTKTKTGRPKKRATYSPEIKWFLKRKASLQIKIIERELGMYANLLHKTCQGDIQLPLKWHKPLTLWVRRFKK